MGAMELNQMRFEVFEANYASRALQCYCRYPIQQFLRFRNIRSLLTWIVLVLYQNMTGGTISQLSYILRYRHCQSFV